MRLKNVILCMCSLAVIPLFAEKIVLDQVKPSRKIYFPAEFDSKVKTGTSPSLRLSRENSVTRPVTLKPNTRYKLTYLIKGDKISSGRKPDGKDFYGARIYFHNGKRMVAVYGNNSNEPDSGTFDWRMGQLEFISGEKTGKARIVFSLSGKGTVWFDDVQINELPREEAVSFRKAWTDDVSKCYVIPEGVFGFFDPGQQVSFQFDVTSKKKDLEYEFRVTDESGREVYRAPRKKLEKKFTVPGQECGYYIVFLDIFSGKEKVYSTQSAFAVNVPLKKRDPFFLFGFGPISILYDGLKRVGGGSLDVKLSPRGPWKIDMEPAQYWEWLRKMHFARVDEGNDFEITLTYTSRIRTKRLFDPRTQEQLDAGYPTITDKYLDWVRRYVRFMTERFKGRVKTWAIQQEIPSATFHKEATWTEALYHCFYMTRVVSRTVRAMDPSIRIAVGGNNMENTLQKEQPVLKDLAPDFDEYVIDGYGGNWNMRLSTPFLPENELKSFYKAAGDLSASVGKGRIIRNHETGYCIAYSDPYDRGRAMEQARLTARILIISKAYVSHLELYRPSNRLWKEARDSDDNMNTIWKPFYRNKSTVFVPQPGGAMYAAAASALSFAKFRRELVSGSVYSYIFQRADGSTLVTLWDIEQERPFALNLPADTVMTNMFGRTKKLAAGKHKLTIGPAPVYLILKHPVEKMISGIERAMQENLPEVVCGGFWTGKDRAQIFVRNLTKNAVKGQFIASTGEKKALTVMPGKIASLEVKMAQDTTCSFRSDRGRTYPAELEQGSLQSVPKLSAAPKLDGSGAWLKGLPSGTLKFPDHIFPKSALQPEKCYFRSERYNPNGHDVSAKYWTAYDSENFYLAVEVDDPVHIQRQTGMDLWRDDSLQFVFSMKDPIPGALRSKAEKPEASKLNYGLALTQKGVLLVQYDRKDSGICSFPANVTRKNNRTFYEVSVPFKALGGRPRRFGFVIFDNNSTAQAKAPYRLEYSGGITGKADDSKLKCLQFE